MNETLTIIPIQFEKIVQSKSYSCIVLNADDKRFGIFSSPDTGKLMQQYLIKNPKQRPMTHDLLRNIFRGFDITIKHVVIYDIQDTIYYGRLFLEQKINDLLHIVEIDARPSDCITLSLIYKSPMYCTNSVLQKTLPYCD